MLSRWAAAATVASTLVLASLGGEVALIAARGGDLAATPLVIALIDRLSVVIGIVTTMTCFSALVSSLGDLVIWLSIHIVAMSLLTSADVAEMPALGTIGRALQRVANPQLDTFLVLSSMRVPWSHVAFYFGTVLLALGLAAFALNRKELTYASE